MKQISRRTFLASAGAHGSRRLPVHACIQYDGVATAVNPISSSSIRRPRLRRSLMHGRQRLEDPHLDSLAAGGARFTNCTRIRRSARPRGVAPHRPVPAECGRAIYSGGHRTASVPAAGSPHARNRAQERGLSHGNGWQVTPGRHRAKSSGTARLRRIVWVHGGMHRLLLAHFLLGDAGRFQSRSRPLGKRREIHRTASTSRNLITEHAIDFVRRCAARDEPFFLYVPYNAPHYPMHAPQNYLDRFPDLRWERRIMAAMLSAVDDTWAPSCASSSGTACATTPASLLERQRPSRETRQLLDGAIEPY